MEKELPLLKAVDDSMYPFIDDRGVSFENIESFVFGEVLGGCGCGNADSFGEMAIELLEHYGTEHDQRTLKVYERPELELMTHWLDSVGLLEHGGSIGGSWLTEKGRLLLENINSLRST